MPDKVTDSFEKIKKTQEQNLKDIESGKIVMRRNYDESAQAREKHDSEMKTWREQQSQLRKQEPIPSSLTKIQPKRNRISCSHPKTKCLEKIDYAIEEEEISACPKCNGALALKSHSFKYAGTGKTGSFSQCQRCGERYPEARYYSQIGKSKAECPACGKILEENPDDGYFYCPDSICRTRFNVKFSQAEINNWKKPHKRMYWRTDWVTPLPDENVIDGDLYSCPLHKNNYRPRGARMCKLCSYRSPQWNPNLPVDSKTGQPKIPYSKLDSEGYAGYPVGAIKQSEEEGSIQQTVYIKKKIK